MSLVMTDAFVTQSADNEWMSRLIGSAATGVCSCKLLQGSHLRYWQVDEASALTTGCVSWASGEARMTTSLRC